MKSYLQLLWNNWFSNQKILLLIFRQGFQPKQILYNINATVLTLSSKHIFFIEINNPKPNFKAVLTEFLMLCNFKKKTQSEYSMILVLLDKKQCFKAMKIIKRLYF